MTIEEIEELIAKNGSITAQPLMDLVVTVVLEAVEAERDACAKVCEAEAEKWEGNDGPICYEARMCAVNIRARGEMAREARIDYVFAFRSELERFAALVISHHVKETRPEVSDSMATWLQQIAYQHGGIGDLSRTEMEFGAMVAAAEREACAKVCERLPARQDIDVRDQCAAAIRARGDV